MQVQICVLNALLIMFQLLNLNSVCRKTFRMVIMYHVTQCVNTNTRGLEYKFTREHALISNDRLTRVKNNACLEHNGGDSRYCEVKCLVWDRFRVRVFPSWRMKKYSRIP